MDFLFLFLFSPPFFFFLQIIENQKYLCQKSWVLLDLNISMSTHLPVFALSEEDKQLYQKTS